MQEVSVEDKWNKKRIFIAVFVLILLVGSGYALKTFVLSDNNPPVKPSIPSALQGVKGISTQEEAYEKNISLPSTSDMQKVLQQKLETIKKDIIHINVTDIASSSPQFQKIVNDLNSLKDYPVNQVKDACQKICNSF